MSRFRRDGERKVSSRVSSVDRSSGEDFGSWNVNMEYDWRKEEERGHEPNRQHPETEMIRDVKAAEKIAE